MIISERIFELLQERGMSQKEFSEKTGIASSSISDWKRKHTNPVSEKILSICEALEVTPNELLSGGDSSGTRSYKTDYFIIAKETELGVFLEKYQALNPTNRGRILGYLEALREQEIR